METGNYAVDMSKGKKLISVEGAKELVKNNNNLSDEDKKVILKKLEE